jgi:hypothetical protein
MDNGFVNTWAISLANGYPTQEDFRGESHKSDGTVAEVGLTLSTSDLYGTPPWADVRTDETLAPPAGGSVPEDSPPDNPG